MDSSNTGKSIMHFYNYADVAREGWGRSGLRQSRDIRFVAVDR